MSGNTFSCVDTPVHIMLGSRMKEGAGGKTYTSSFPVKIESEGSTIVSKSTDIEKYLSIDLNDGALLTSTARIVNLSYARIDNESLI